MARQQSRAGVDVRTRSLAVALALIAFFTESASASAPALVPIKLELYMETLCPYCANATVKQVAPLMAHPVLGPRLSLSYTAWGNARENVSAPSCQHGPNECALNTLLSCAIALYPSKWFDFALCLEEAVLEAKSQEAAAVDLSVAAIAARCSPPAAATSAALISCAEGSLGRALSHMAAQRTAALVPKHEYVPWFVLNGVPLRGAADNLLAFLCVSLDAATRVAARDVCADPVVEEQQEEEEEALLLQAS
jgi:interferon, gamma-inducible protein 30